MCRSTWLLCLASLLPLQASAVEIDGRIDPAEWQGAQHVTDFRKTQPLNGEPASLPTEAWILATPDGLAVAFRNSQPASVPRTDQRVQRDFEAQVDRVNVMVDFDGDGRSGYDFTVSSTDGIFDALITNEQDFSKDWDGNWQHAVTGDADSWSVEVLIPWYIAPMRKGSDGIRRMKIYLDRVIGSTGERSAWPVASFERPRFLSDFAAIEVPQYSQALLAVTPYVSGLYDNVGKQSQSDAGADIFWKPNGQFQMTATINPDFGQVESDNLVVNFDATETFVSEKRPFFTENQSIFDFTTPSDFSQLIYTRRVGGSADDGSGPGDITAAAKFNGSLGATKYGVFIADEGDEAGRTFSAMRFVRDLEDQNVGVMVTHVDRPYLDRLATVYGVDHNWRPNPKWSVQTRIIGSEIDQSGEETRDTGVTSLVEYEMGDGWRQQWLGMHFGNDLQINDFGFLSRNSVNYGHWEVARRFTSLPEASRYASKDWRWRISSNHNDHGESLGNQFRMTRQSALRNGSNEFAQINVTSARVDDLITRGNGSLDLPSRVNVSYAYSRPRKGAWGHDIELYAGTGGLSGNSKVGYSLAYTATYFISDAFSVYVTPSIEQTPDWVLWQHDNLVGSFKEAALGLDAGINWNIGDKQELRVKLQSLSLDAQLQQGYRVVDGDAVESSDPIDDFSLANMGFQIRYRYEIAPLSYLYVVYGRGGYEQNPYSDNPGSVLGDSYGLRDSEQLLVKFSYRFEL